MRDLGRLLMLVGAAVFALGALLALAGRLPWLGRLPGNVVFERGPVTCYFPLATSLILSVVLTLAFWFFRR
jgi:hypothetical protein